MAKESTNIITLTGDLGSGKSKTGKLICSHIPGFDYISTGDIQRKLAEDLGMTTLEMNKLAETDPTIDIKIDSIFVSLKNTSEKLVVDSRMAWYFLPNSFKIMLKADIDITTQRVMHDKMRKSETAQAPDYEVLKRSLQARKASETKRFIEKYNANGNDVNNFDIIVETSFISADDVAEIVIKNYYKWVNKQSYAKFWVSPKQLLPTKQTDGIIKNIGFDEAEPVVIVVYREMYFILDGHKRVSDALKNGVHYISTVLINSYEILNDAKSANQFIEKQYHKSIVDKWQEDHGFAFFKTFIPNLYHD
ncbi:MAG: cytidylate kinase family protein [Cytophagales bacterium]